MAGTFFRGRYSSKFGDGLPKRRAVNLYCQAGERFCGGVQEARCGASGGLALGYQVRRTAGPVGRAIRANRLSSRKSASRVRSMRSGKCSQLMM